jgi:hypothetical protein
MTSEARIMRIKMKIQSLMDLIEEIELEEEEANESGSQKPVTETEQTTDDT